MTFRGFFVGLLVLSCLLGAYSLDVKGARADSSAASSLATTLTSASTPRPSSAATSTASTTRPTSTSTTASTTKPTTPTSTSSTTRPTSTASTTKPTSTPTTASTTRPSSTTTTASTTRPTSTTTASTTRPSSTTTTGSTTRPSSTVTTASTARPTSPSTTAQSTTRPTSPSTTAQSTTRPSSGSPGSTATSRPSSPLVTSSSRPSSSTARPSSSTARPSSSTARPSSSTARPSSTVTTRLTTPTPPAYKCNFDTLTCGLQIKNSNFNLTDRTQLTSDYTFTDFTSISQPALNGQYCQIPFADAGYQYYHCKPRVGQSQCMTSSGFATCSNGRFLSGRNSLGNSPYQSSATISLLGLSDNQFYRLSFYAYMYGLGSPADCQYTTDYIGVDLSDYYSGLNSIQLRLQDFETRGWKKFTLDFKKYGTPTLTFLSGRYSINKCQVFFGFDEIEVTLTQMPSQPTGPVTNTMPPSRVSTTSDARSQRATIFLLALGLIASRLF